MAEMIPDTLPASSTAGERRVFAALARLPDDCLIYYEPVVRRRYPDLIAILPEVGVLVIEVKDWRLAELGSVNADTVTITRRGIATLVPHPRRQARGYMLRLMDECRRHPQAGMLMQKEGRHAGGYAFPFCHIAVEAEPFWTAFLRSLTRRGLRGVKLVISDSHEGLKKAAAKVLSATWQRCRVHFMRNALAHVGTKQRAMVAAAIRTAFTQETREAAHKEWRAVADRPRERFPKLGALMDEAENDVLAHLAFPKEHWQQLHSTNPLERLNGEIKRRTDVVAIFPNEAAIVRLVGALLLEQNDEWAASRARYMSLEKLSQISDDPQARPRRIAAA